MVQFDDNRKAEVGCILVLKATGGNEGELTIEELEEIDKQMLEVGSSRTGQRIGVSTVAREHGVTIEYAYQESLNAKSLSNLEDRLEAFTPLKEPFVVVDVQAAQFVEGGGDQE